MSKEPTKGFLIVASKTVEFYRMAINLSENIRDYIPDANICLVCEEWMIDGREDVADVVLHCGNGQREKLWALDKTPWDITLYLDADMEIKHEDFTTVWDQLKDHDIVFAELTEERSENFAIFKWPKGQYKLCGGIFLYDMRKPIVKEFMRDWSEYFVCQRDGQWWPEVDESGCPIYSEDGWPLKLKGFDQTTLYWLTEHEKKYKDLKIGFFEDDERWNWFCTYRPSWNHSGKPPIIWHWSGSVYKGVEY